MTRFQKLKRDFCFSSDANTGRGGGNQKEREIKKPNAEGSAANDSCVKGAAPVFFFIFFSLFCRGENEKSVARPCCTPREDGTRRLLRQGHPKPKYESEERFKQRATARYIRLLGATVSDPQLSVTNHSFFLLPSPSL